ncbi:MAG: amidohydrolase family protein [Tepidiformaceae bacterium]
MSQLILRGGHAWDGLASARFEAGVVIDGDTISAIGKDAGAPRAVDISGCTVLPGLIEAHAHLCFNAAANWREVYDRDTPGTMLLRMAANGRSMLEAGITTVRDLGAPTSLAVELREAFAGGLATGPRLLVSGAPITTTGGHCHFMGGEADGPLDLQRAVRDHLKAGVDWIKVMATGGNMTRHTNTFAAQYTVDELRTLIADAHRLRRKVTAHAHGVEGIRVAVEAGVDMIEHCTFTVPGGIELDELLLAAIAAKGIIVSPTTSVGYRTWTDDGQRERRRQVTRAIFANGCKVVMSTDCGIPGVPHAALAGGMSVLQELSGGPAVEILKLATSTSAALLELPDRGVIAPGKAADLVVVEGDPTQDLGALERVRYVFKAGEMVFERPSISERVD